MSIFIKSGLIIVMIFGLLVSFGKSQTIDNYDIKTYTKNMHFEENSLYFILRGSNTKLGGFAKQYNKTNAYATHVALGVFKDSLQIFHANTVAQDGQHIISENLNNFITREKDEYTYLAFWKVNNTTTEEIDNVLAEIAILKTAGIKFDYKFNFQSNDKLYCSEFIYKVMNKATANNFEIPMTKMVVPEAHRFYIKKDTLVCYPSDYFLDYASITFISEWKYDASQ